MRPLSLPSRLRGFSARWLWLAAAVLVVVLMWTTSGRWGPAIGRWTAADSSGAGAPADPDDAHDHDRAASIQLSPQARKNIGLVTGEVRLERYARSITIPAMVVERPGRTHVKVTAPITGVVSGLYVIGGQAVESERLLFRIRLTHEDVVKAQTDFLRTLGQLDVEQREIARLDEIAGGAVANRVVLERKYERDKLQAALDAEREALRLHGLSAEQIDRIAQERRLLREIQVYVPLVHADASLHDDAEAEDHPLVTSLERSQGEESKGGAISEAHAERRLFVIEELHVQTGEAVTAGKPLCTLADYSALYIEGRAFEQDGDELVAAAREARSVTALNETDSDRVAEVPDLRIVYVANHVDEASRALHFYVALPNEIVYRTPGPEGREFLTWRFKQGQRMQLRVPVEEWEHAIVLPVDAVAREGAEAYVFVENGNVFERREVHVRHRDQLSAVIADDGSLFPGESVAVSAAHQLQMALEQQSAGEAGGHAHHGHVH
ncbi:MAG: efflux RND transporter periplasmic adaptor subunit [Planctomycetes bacterium]|nr:efflux RND transporter periplasmic adaptor subunit [Planctomycetota bacterium]